ncbi:hypothetical protein CBS101457_002765 [Exobasidium rhododendri]|nr:hypothetical protein CBS101457_002765 [Exobasidium rhododendri]
MIARRLGRAIQLHQVTVQGSTNRSLKLVNVASTSYKSQTPSSKIRFSSSLPGAFSHTSPKLAKKRSKGSRGTTIIEEFPEEDEDAVEEDEDIFAGITSEAAEVKVLEPAKESRKDLPPFSEQLGSLKGKLDAVTYEKNAHLHIRKSDWRDLLHSASSLEELRKCMDVATYWNELSYLKISKIPKLSAIEGNAFVQACTKLSYPELAYYALVNRADTGLEYNVEVLRKLQRSLVDKLIKLSPTSSQATSEKIEKRLLESQMMEGAARPVEEWQKETVEGQEAIQVLKARLSLVDRTLANAALTSATASDLRTVDLFSVTLSIRGMLKAFDLNKVSAKNDSFLENQVQPRIKAAFTVFVREAKPDAVGGLYAIDHSISLTCKIMFEYLLRNGLADGKRSKRDEVINILSKIVERAPATTQEKYQKETDQMLKDAGQTL